MLGAVLGFGSRANRGSEPGMKWIIVAGLGAGVMGQGMMAQSAMGQGVMARGGMASARSGPTGNPEYHGVQQGPLIVFDAPYAKAPLDGVRSTQCRDEQRRALAWWNRGGRDGKYHPEPRVIVDEVKVTGALTAQQAQRAARAGGYGIIRGCYDPELAREPTLGGKLTLRLMVRQNGSVSSGALVGRSTLANARVEDCLRRQMTKIKFPSARRGGTRVTFRVALYPGDVPLTTVDLAPREGEEAPEQPSWPGRLQGPLVQAVVARDAYQGLRDCYEQGLGRMPGLWGRLALRLDVAASGAVVSAVQVESMFPDPKVVACAAGVVQGLGLPAPVGGQARIVVPIRFGEWKSKTP